MYKITYQVNGFVQYKELISKERFDNEFTPFRIAIHKLECRKPPKSEKENLKIYEKELQILENEFKQAFPHEIFVIDSPLYKAIEIGVIVLPKIQGGNHLVNIIKL